MDILKEQKGKNKPSCPRCSHPDVRIEHKGKENQKIIWTLFYCKKCCFGWRDSEPQTTIAQREQIFQINVEQFDKFPVILR
ncbi:transposase-like protein [Paenibacillus sp. PvR052]|nr:transposase-like protein [Paenibacillus sp. PvP091]MBP1172090.1 transposase-like protein [Paenibacillus sp. PvR098]MBP2438471.1 transposase-like protein [Paenibacillus sp. PvP052]